MGGAKAIFPRRRKKREKGSVSRLRIFVWATILGLIFGAIEFGQPVEDALRIGRNWIRQQPASGDIVIVAVDDKSLGRVEDWPWPRNKYIPLLRNLEQYGARNIYIDLDLSHKSQKNNDKALAETFDQIGRKITLAVRFIVDPSSGRKTDHFPLQEFRRSSELAHINVRYNMQGAVWDLTYAMEYAGTAYPSFAASMAKKRGVTGDTFRIDYSIDPRSIPVFSAVDVMGGKIAPDLIANKQVILGTTSTALGDVYYLPGYGRMAGAYIHALGAETLNNGIPTELGWGLAFAFCSLIAALCLLISSVRVAIALLGAASITLLITPILLEMSSVTLDVMPAFFMLAFVMSRLAWANFRQSYRLRGTTNTVSGLPNLIALRQDNLVGHRPLIAARIQNYAEIASALPPEEEKHLVEQIATRLMVGGSNIRLYHGDEGIFAWSTEQAIGSVGDHLEALHTFFRSPITVGDNQIDLTVTFGLDAGSDRSLGNRLGSALVAADEAAAEGLKWKTYDPAKLKDAAWKLSLLGQLDKAIEAGDLWVAYQPKLDLASRNIVGAEALVRWTHPSKGPISPAEFIPAAEQSDRIEKLTVYVLERAVAAAAAINRRGIPFDISVNVSARLINNPTLAKIIISLLQENGLAAERLTLEVTETAALNTSKSDLEALFSLRYSGVQISIDDYGTGLSTLDYLKKLPATEIKIDQSFIRAVDKSHSDRLLVNSTIQLAHSLGQKVVAEGVEDQTTLEMLTRMGCDVAQGFWIGHPMTFRAISRLILSAHRRQAA